MNQPCPICGGVVLRTFIPSFYQFKGKNFDLVKCGSCGLCRVDPIPGESEIKEMYGDEYFQENWVSGRCSGSYPEIFAKRIGEYRAVAEAMERETRGPKGTLLEIGCAGGGFLDFAKARGWKVDGLEISAWGVKHSEEHYGIAVRQGDLVRTELPENAYQAVFMGDVFEHFSDPVVSLEKINRSLRDGGLIVCLLPMYLSSWTFGFLRFLCGTMRSFGVSKEFLVLIRLEAKEAAVNPPYHIFEYSPVSIRRLLGKAGFRVLTVKGVLPVPEFLRKPSGIEPLHQRTVRMMTLFLYQAIKFGTEHFNFPLVRALVIARKERTFPETGR